MVVEVFLLKNIAKDWLGFLPLLRRVSHVPDLASLGNTANVCVGSMVYNI
jgi:hypothetical protein